MKGFGIYVKNNLLEPKHIENMGEAVWLYLWLLDKMTSVNENGVGKVMNNQPIQYEYVQQELGVSRQVYVRWVSKLRTHGYIRTLRTAYGLCITVQKAEKIFGNRGRSIKDDTSGSRKTDTSKPARSRKSNTADVSKVIQEKRQNRASNNNNTSNNTNTIQTTTNVVADKPVRHGKPEINEMFDYWSQAVGYDIETRVTANRRACSNLIKKYGADRLKRLIDGVAMAQSDRYAPRIADFSGLQSRGNELIAWGKTKLHADIEETPRPFKARSKK